MNLHDLNGRAMSFSAHSSLTSIVSYARPIAPPVVLCSLACLIRAFVYSGMSVFKMFQKYSRSGTRPFGNYDGKYYMNSGLSYICGQKLRTDSSSYFGTLIRLTWLRSSNFFEPPNTSFKKSLFILHNWSSYTCKLTYLLTYTQVAGRAGAAPWSTGWSHFSTRTCRRAHAASSLFSSSRARDLQYKITQPSVCNCLGYN